MPIFGESMCPYTSLCKSPTLKHQPSHWRRGGREGGERDQGGGGRGGREREEGKERMEGKKERGREEDGRRERGREKGRE